MDSRLRKPQHIYECYLEISRPKVGEDGHITCLYPKDYELEGDTRKQLPKFAFPTTVVNDNEEHFTFVLTDLSSKYRFGFCHYRPKGDTCMCFISDLPWYKVFYRALDKISELKLNMQNELVEPLLSGLRSHPIPQVGEECLHVDVEDMGQSYSFPLPILKKLPEIPTDHNLTFFYTNIHYNVLLHLFANMIFERRIIITSSNLSLLSASVHGAAMLLYPLHWQHIFIPIMPQHLMDYCAAPMPFFVGIHSSLMEQVRRQMQTDELVILDMDENVIESPHVDDLTMMPDDVISQLKHVLKKESSGYGDNAAKAFLLAMVSMIGGYRKALKFREGEKEVLFDEETFLKSRAQMEEFLSTLLHFQHFRQFINHKIEQLKNQTYERDLFDKEVMFYEEEMKGTTQEQIKAAFDKFVSSTRGGGKKLLEQGGKWGVQFQKGVTKGYGKIVDKRAFQKFVKETKKQLQGIGKEAKFEELSTHIENAAPLTGTEKSNTFPNMHRSGSTVSTSSQPGAVGKKGPPRPVIPYHLHQEGKRKLAESLMKQQKKNSTGSELPASMLRLLNTPPDTPQSTQPPDDQAEKASLDSRGSTEASTSVSSGDVATGNLVDLTVLPEDTGQSKWIVGGGGEREGTEKVGGGGEGGRDGGEEDTIEMGNSESSTESDSIISSASSSSVEREEGTQLRDWVRFDDEEGRPPLPPPRSALEEFHEERGSSHVAPVPVEKTEPSANWNPFNTPPTATGRVSPFDDFSASVAQSLFSQSRNRNSLDAYSASLMANASRDLYKALDTHHESENAALPEPLIPTSSSTNVASMDSTSAQGALHPPSQYNPFAEPPKFTLSSSSPNFTHMTGVNGNPTSFHKCPSSLGQSSPHTGGDRAHAKRPPPPKPQPYSGKPVSAVQQQGNDAFSNLLSGMSMQAYANSGKSSNSSSPAMQKAVHSTSTQQTAPSSQPTHQAVHVESPLV